MTTDAIIDFSTALVKRRTKAAVAAYKRKYAPLSASNDAGKVGDKTTNPAARTASTSSTPSTRTSTADDDVDDEFGDAASSPVTDLKPSSDSLSMTQKQSPPPKPVYYHKTVSLRKPKAPPEAPPLRCLATPLQIGSIPRAHLPKIETDADYKEVKNLDLSGYMTDVLGKSLLERMSQRFLIDTVRQGEEDVDGENKKGGGGDKNSGAAPAEGDDSLSDKTMNESQSMDTTADSINLTKADDNTKPFLRKPLSSRDLNAEKIAVKYRWFD